MADEHGRLLVKNTYEGGLVTQQELGNGDLYAYNYQWSENSFYAVKVVVRLPDGSQQEIATADSVPEYVRFPRK